MPEYKFHIGMYVNTGKERDGSCAFRWSRHKTYTRKSDVTSYLNKWGSPERMAVSIDVKDDDGKYHRLTTVFSQEWEELKETLEELQLAGK